MLKRRLLNDKPLKMYTKRFYPAGTYTWIVPPGCTEVDVFLVGAGSGAGQMYSGSSYGGGGGGYTKTYRGSGYVKPFSGTWMGTSTEERDGDAISVTPGQEIEIIVGGGVSKGNGGYTQFMNSNYRAEGGKLSDRNGYGSSGGSGGSSEDSSSIGTGGNGGSDGSMGQWMTDIPSYRYSHEGGEYDINNIQNLVHNITLTHNDTDDSITEWG